MKYRLLVLAFSLIFSTLTTITLAAANDLGYSKKSEWVTNLKVLDTIKDDSVDYLNNKIYPRLLAEDTSKDVAEKVLLWVWSDHGNNTKIDLQSISAENRNRSPLQTIWSKQTACREFNLLYVAALRSVGIPARHCTAAYWYGRDSYHFFTEYWDKELQQWVAVDATDDQLQSAEPPKDRVLRGRWNSLVYYAHPAAASETDIYGKCLWSECVNITSHVARVFTLDVRFPAMKGKSTVSSYIWNMGTWRLIHSTQEITEEAGKRSCKVELGKLKEMNRPVMITATDGTSLHWKLATLTGEDQTLVLQDVEANGPLCWRPGENVKEEPENP